MQLGALMQGVMQCRAAHTSLLTIVSTISFITAGASAGRGAGSNPKYPDAAYLCVRRATHAEIVVANATDEIEVFVDFGPTRNSEWLRKTSAEKLFHHGKHTSLLSKLEMSHSLLNPAPLGDRAQCTTCKKILAKKGKTEKSRTKKPK